MRHLRTAFCFIVGIIFIVAVGLYCARSTAPTIVYVQDPNYIPSAKQIQERLMALDKKRYNVGPKGADGFIGTDSRTAWDNYICDQYAIRAIEGR